MPVNKIISGRCFIMEKSTSSNIIYYSFIAAGIVIAYIAATADFESAGSGLALAVLGVFLILIGIFKGRIFQMILELISGLF